MTVPPIDQREYTHVETATFALGCFWGPDGRFGVMPGVIRTRVGYTGGTTPNPTYKAIGDHSEAVQIDFDPAKLSYSALLDVFWQAQNPTAAPYSRQYMNAVWYHSEAQRETIAASREGLQATLTGDIQTAVAPLGVFTRAEDYHQKWYLRRHNALMPPFERMLTGRAFVDSTAAARVNGFVMGQGHPAQLREEIGSYGLPDEAQAALLAYVGVET